MTSFEKYTHAKNVDKTVGCAQRLTFSKDDFDLSLVTYRPGRVSQAAWASSSLWCAELTGPVTSSFWKVHVY